MSEGRIFISHSAADRVQVNRLVESLKSHGIRTWIAPDDIRPGGDWPSQTDDAIENCAAFVVAISPTSNSSAYVRAEAERAFNLGKPIFPVRLSALELARGLRLFLSLSHWTDAFGPGEKNNLEQLAIELAGLTETPLPPPPPEPEPEPQPQPQPPPTPAGKAGLGRIVKAVSGVQLIETLLSGVTNRSWLWTWRVILYYALFVAWVFLLAFILDSLRPSRLIF